MLNPLGVGGLKMFKKILLLLTMSSCLTLTKKESLTEDGSKIKVVQKINKNKCQNLGHIYGNAYSIFISNATILEHAKNNLLNEAAKKEATHIIFLDGKVNFDGSSAAILGEAYRCE